MNSNIRRLVLLALTSLVLCEPRQVAGQLPGYRIWSSYTNLTVGEQFVAYWQIPVLSTTLDDWLGIYTYPNGTNAIDWKFAALRDYDTTFNAPEDAGLYELHYFEHGIFSGSTLAAVSDAIRVRPPVDNPYAITNYPSRGNHIIAFGDSLVLGVGSTSGNDFPDVLSRRLGEPILNKSVSGDTTTDALQRIERDVLDNDPGIVLVLLGANDALQNVEPSVTDENLRTVVRLIQERGAVVILIGVQSGIFTDLYRDRFHNIAAETGVAFVPNILRGIFDNPLHLSDTFHPNDSGYEIIADRIFPALEKLAFPQDLLVKIDRQGTNVVVRIPTKTGLSYELFSYDSIDSISPVRIAGPMPGTGSWIDVRVLFDKPQKYFKAKESQ